MGSGTPSISLSYLDFGSTDRLADVAGGVPVQVAAELVQVKIFVVERQVPHPGGRPVRNSNLYGDLTIISPTILSKTTSMFRKELEFCEAGGGQGLRSIDTAPPLWQNARSASGHHCRLD